MAGFLKGFLAGTGIGLAGLAALSLALPMIGDHPAAPRLAPKPRAGSGLVLPDTARPVAKRPEAGLQVGRPAVIDPAKPAAAPAAAPSADPDARPDQALATVPAAAQFDRARREGAPQLPAALDAPDRGVAPAEAPAMAAPGPEAAPSGQVAQPGARPDQPVGVGAGLAAPAAGADAPAAPQPEAPVPVPPPGEVQAPALAAPQPEPGQMLPNPVTLPTSPPPAILAPQDGG
ncbi:hypothetical protein ACEYYB_09150 [Paracoccus sp. p4-l81]|uniref:hypothetical protein n=1 Tax=Paracoccus sp. p4-l81 TaxID=3342806 RepID=UPI0035B8E349